MKQDEQFDELARRKLDEQSFPFEEADWSAARALIDAQRGRTGGMPWAWLTLIVLLLAGGLAWYMLADGRTAQQADKPVAGLNTPPAVPTEVPVNDVEQPANTIAVSSGPIPMVDPTGNLPEPLGDAIPSPVSLRPAVEMAPPSAQPSIQQLREAAATGSPTDAFQHTISDRSSAALTDHDPVVVGEQHIQQDVPLPEAPAESREQPVGERYSTTHAEAVDGSDEEENGPDGAPVATPTIHVSVPVGSQSADTSAHNVKADRPITAQDSTSLAMRQAAQANDSISSMELPLPLVPERAPWQIGVAGGLFSSRSSYQGGNSAEWAYGSNSATSPSFGAELMHMGHRFGLGFGLHWGSYAEKLRTDAWQERFTYLDEHWGFVPFQTTILMITDTLPGSPPSYQGTPVDTVLNIFMQVTDTLTEEHTTRDARDGLNRVSYLEVPLLVDVHTARGRWTFGLRGGPAVGLLMGRSGALPNATNDGYITYGDQPFRRLMLGYTARAYAHYRFHAGWSVGLEPALRGQLLNSLDSGALGKRSHAAGLMLGLRYQFR